MQNLCQCIFVFVINKIHYFHQNYCVISFEMGKLILKDEDCGCARKRNIFEFKKKNYLFVQCFWNGCIPYLKLIKILIEKHVQNLYYICVCTGISHVTGRKRRSQKSLPFYFHTNLCVYSDSASKNHTPKSEIQILHQTHCLSFCFPPSIYNEIKLNALM